MFDAVLKKGASDYRTTTVLLVILFIMLVWIMYKKYMKPYAEFPTYPLIRHIVYCTVTRKIPKHLPLSSFAFQVTMRIMKSFRKDGAVLIWMPEPVLAIFDKDVVKALNNDPAVLDTGKKYHMLKIFLGTGLVTSNGATWKTHRKLLNPVFHVGVLKRKLPIFNKGAKMLVKQLEECMDESSIDVHDLLKHCAFNNICEFALGLKMDTPENKETVKNFQDKVSNLLEIGGIVFVIPWIYLFLVKFSPYSWKWRHIIEDLHNFTREIISKMKRNIALQQADRTIGDGRNEDDETRKSFAHILLDHHLKDNSFTSEDVKDQVITFMIGGYENVSFALLWTLFLLGNHPEVQDQAYNEVDSLEDGDIKCEDLNKLKYLECVIKETMRLFPVIPMYLRTLGKEMTCGKYKVPKGTDILFIPYLLHRDPEVYPEPEKFDPCRFMEGESTKIHENYYPFAEGIRHCIGKRFAMMEMKVILAFILRRFEIKSMDSMENMNVSWSIHLSPARPLQFRFTPRM